MSKTGSLRPHPRLYLDETNQERCRNTPDLPFLESLNRQIEFNADRYLKSDRVDFPAGHHNAHLVRARKMQGEIGTLLVRWIQTEKKSYRDAVVKRIARMGRWKYWSWKAWRREDRRPAAVFDLSYGENSATIAWAYDWLYDGLTKAEKRDIIAVARKWSFASGMANCRPGVSFWFGRPDSNWNTVCAGGLGMLCLAMAEDIPEAGVLLLRIEKSIRPFMLKLDETDGGWPEGTGYWRYGMKYAFMYLMSRENAEGREHPLFHRKNTRRTLRFPLDFYPRGLPCSFGDVNRFSPSAFHYAAAERLGEKDIMAALDAELMKRFGNNSSWPRARGWPEAAEWVSVHRNRITRISRRRKPKGGARLYHGLDWGILADSFEAPGLYVSVRGGTTRESHSHRDLMSFNLVVKDEKMIEEPGVSEYLDTTFSERRNEIPEISPGMKNTILINGVGIAVDSSLDRTEIVRAKGVEGLRLAGTPAMGNSGYESKAAKLCVRAVLMLEKRAVLVVDRVVLPFAGRVESRMHTFCEARLHKNGALLKGERRRLRVQYASDVEAMFCTARPAPTKPTVPAPLMLRWCSVDRSNKVFTFATLMTPGGKSAAVKIVPDSSGLTVKIRTDAWRKNVGLTAALKCR
ncbi:MAG: heparinase II/III family protein [Kiritimatiellia bacterium]